MSLVWTLIASFLYTEIAIVLLFVLPIFSPQRWQRFFKSRFLAMLRNQAQTYFYLLLAVLVLFVLEAIREMNKYSQHSPSGESHPNLEMQHSMRLFRAQRNFYIAGFSIFLSLVIRRLIVLISNEASLLAQAEALMKQGQSATAVARNLMKEQVKTDTKESADLTGFKTKIAELEKELQRERKDKEALKSQADSLNKEYDRLTEEYSKLQKKVTITAGDEKKDE